MQVSLRGNYFLQGVWNRQIPLEVLAENRRLATSQGCGFSSTTDSFFLDGKFSHSVEQALKFSLQQRVSFPLCLSVFLYLSLSSSSLS